MTENKKLDKELVNGAFNAYQEYSENPQHSDFVKRLFGEYTRKKKDAESLLKVIDPNNSYKQQLQAELKELEMQKLPSVEYEVNKAKESQEKLKSYFDAGGRTEIVDKYVQELQEKILIGIKDEGKDEKKYKTVLEQAYKDLKENKEYQDTYLALTSTGLAKLDEYLAKVDKVISIYISLADKALGGDGKGNKVNWYSTPVEQIAKHQARAAAKA